MKSKIDPLEYEEAYFRKKPISTKQLQKKAQNNDRSKYKKSNLDQKAKHNALLAHTHNDLAQGLVVTLSREGYRVAMNDGTQFLCTLKGALKKDKSLDKNLVVVGDHVYFDKTNNTDGVIYAVKPRRSELVRLDNLKRRHKQLMAANIDQVFITSCLFAPCLKPFLIDRYILAAIKSGIEPIVVINKIDYLEERPSFVSDKQFEQDKEYFLALKKMEAAYPFKLFFVSSKTGEGVDLIREEMKGKTSVFAGQSGTGKSSLLNALLGENLKVGRVKEKTCKGSHTTTIASLIPLGKDSYCIDTPGIKSFGIWDLNPEDVSLAFPEFTSFSERCAFRKCTHQTEKGCSVKAAVENGELPQMRYFSYLQLLEEENLPFWK